MPQLLRVPLTVALLILRIFVPAAWLFTTVEAWSLAVSKDDKLLASGTQKGSVNLWALDGHKKASSNPSGILCVVR